MCLTDQFPPPYFRIYLTTLPTSPLLRKPRPSRWPPSAVGSARPPSRSRAVLAAHWLRRPSVCRGRGLPREGGIPGPRLRERSRAAPDPRRASDQLPLGVPSPFNFAALLPSAPCSFKLFQSSHPVQDQVEDAAVLGVKQAVDWISGNEIP